MTGYWEMPEAEKRIRKEQSQDKKGRRMTARALRRDFELKAKPIVQEETWNRIIVTAVKLDTGHVEIITNYNNVKDKVRYYLDNYDEEFRLKRNPDIQIVNYMII